tara:strand:+ start:341 stop:1045 length:705 start_codon:yes stop_codon:yes gene_type:complete
MNTTVIVLGVILILVIVYMVFQDYFTGTTSLKEQTNLKSGVQTQSGLKLGSPESKNVTYSVWAYVENLASGDKMIFSRDKDLHVGFNASRTFIVDVGGNRNVTDVDGENTGETIEVTHNFPLQKWVHILVTTEASTNGRIVDVYLDGKMVKSVNITYTDSQLYSPTGEDNIIFDSFDCYISKFERIPKTFDPKSAYNKYKEGNGGSNLGNALGNFGLKFAVTKDEIETTAFQLF